MGNYLPFQKGHGAENIFGTLDEVLLAIGVEGCVECVVAEPGRRLGLPLLQIKEKYFTNQQ